MTVRRDGYRPIPRSVIMSSNRKGRILSSAVILAVGCAVLLGRTYLCPGNDYQRYHDKSFRVVRVVDGDTLDIDARDGKRSVTRVRLWGVDTPEVDKDGKGSMYYGDEAAEFASSLLSGKSVHIVLSPDKTRGLYGRLLAYVYLERDGVMLNELLVEKGYAYADRRFKHLFADQFRRAEQRAKRDAEGLWAHVKESEMPAWRRRHLEWKRGLTSP